MTKKKIKVFEGFAGYGGGSFGLKRSGLKYEVIGYSENDPYCCELYEAKRIDSDYFKNS